MRAELGIPAGAPLLGLVGNINPQKGVEHFVAAAELVARERPDAWFVVAGARMPTHAAYLQRLEDQIGAAGLRERVLVLGERADVDAVLAALDVLLITSVPASEGIPTVALEAMATGVPVVTTDVGAAAEAVRDGVTGAVVRRSSPRPSRRRRSRCSPTTRAGRRRAAPGGSTCCASSRSTASPSSTRRPSPPRATAPGRAARRAWPSCRGPIPDYRVPLFALLAERVGAGFEVWTGEAAFEPTIRTVSPLPPWARLAPGRFPRRAPGPVAAAPVPAAAAGGRRRRRAQPARPLHLGAARARRAAGRRTVLWGHAWPRGGRGSRTDLLRHGQRRLATALVTYSETQRAQLRERMPGAEVHAAPNAVAPAAAMRPAGGAAPATDFLYVGRLVPEKKPALLVRGVRGRGRTGSRRTGGSCSSAPGPRRRGCARSRTRRGSATGSCFAGHVGDAGAAARVYATAIASVSPGYVGLSITQSLGFGVPMIHADDEPHSPEVEAAVPGFNAVRSARTPSPRSRTRWSR